MRQRWWRREGVRIGRGPAHMILWLPETENHSAGVKELYNSDSRIEPEWVLTSINLQCNVTQLNALNENAMSYLPTLQGNPKIFSCQCETNELSGLRYRKLTNNLLLVTDAAVVPLPYFQDLVRILLQLCNRTGPAPSRDKNFWVLTILTKRL